MYFIGASTEVSFSPPVFLEGKGVLLTIKARGNGFEYRQGQFFVCLVWPRISFIKEHTRNTMGK